MDHDRAGVRAGRRQCAAFADLCTMPGRACVTPARQGQGGDGRRVGGAPCDDNVGPCCEGGLNLFRSGERYDIAAALQRFCADPNIRSEGFDTPFGQRFGHEVNGLPGFQNGHAKRHALFGSNFTRDFDKPVHRIVSPASASRSDHQRHARLCPRQHQFAPLGFGRSAGVLGCAGPKIMRTAVCRASVDGDQVRALCHAAGKGVPVIAKPEGARGYEDFGHFGLSHGVVLSRKMRPV